MTTTRKQYSPKFKAKVALEAIRGERTLTQLASQYHVHPIQVGQWRKTAQGWWDLEDLMLQRLWAHVAESKKSVRLSRGLTFVSTRTLNAGAGAEPALCRLPLCRLPRLHRLRGRRVI